MYHAPGEADLLIVQKAVESSILMDTVLLFDDTDLLILLCNYASLDSHSIFFQPEPKKNTKYPKVWDIKAVNEQLGPEICAFIHFLQAIVGCCITSHLYSIGKGTSLKKFISSSHFPDKAKVIKMQIQLPQWI